MRFIITILFSLFMICTVSAQTYFNIYVNGTDSSAITQGDLMAWEFDVAEPGASADLQFVLDVDENGSHGEGDIVLIQFVQTDGQMGDDGPGDSSSVQDGIVYSGLGPFGFAPGHYIFIVSAGENSISHTLVVSALAEPPATINGTISKDEVTAPSAELENIMVIGQLDDGFVGFWTGLTDTQGDYTINVPTDGVGEVWQVELFTDEVEGYIVSERHQQTINSGANNGFDFHFSIPNSYVYGGLYNQNEEPIIANDYISLRNTSTNQSINREIIDGRYLLPVSFPAGEDSGQFQMELWGEYLVPNYMVPFLYNDSTYRFTIHQGDSIEKNVYLEETDSEIYVQVFIDGGEPGMQFEIQAYDNRAATYTYTDNSGSGTLAVVEREGYYYYVSINTDEQGGTPLPDGYTIEGEYQVEVLVGDTARFYIVGAPSSISGAVSFVEGDGEINWDTDDFRIFVEESDWNQPIGNNPSDSLTYNFDLANGYYTLWFEDYSDNYLSRPTRYENIHLNNEDVDSLNFDLNYRHAELTIKLINAPFNPDFEWWSINTMGEYPDVYQTYEDGDSDSTFHFRVCDGDWYVSAPHSNDTINTVINVSNQSNQYYLEIDYNTGEIVTAINQDRLAQPFTFKLEQNYPNPFNPSTTIQYELAAAGKVDISVYDIIGREVAKLLSDNQQAGSYSIKFNGANLPSGLYFYRIETSSGYSHVRKMILVK